MKSKVVSAAEAVALIHDQDTLICSGFGVVGVPDALTNALGEVRYAWVHYIPDRQAGQVVGLFVPGDICDLNVFPVADGDTGGGATRGIVRALREEAAGRGLFRAAFSVGTLLDLRDTLAFMAETYRKDIYLVEVAYNWRPKAFIGALR